MKRKHCELIKAWADGAEIECKDDDLGWMYDNYPSWYPGFEYRVKPEPKPDVMFYSTVHDYKDGDTYAFVSSAPKGTPNIKLIFDGETGKFKGSEVV